MKKTLCATFTAVCLLSLILYAFAYAFAEISCNMSDGAFRAISVSAIVGIILLGAMLVTALAYIRPSTEGWFPEKDKPLPSSDKPLFFIAASVTALFLILSFARILSGYSSGVTETTALDQLKTRLLLLCLGSSVGAYAFYRSYRSLRK